MRTLSPAPSGFVDPSTGAPRFGSYVGPLPPVELGASPMKRALRRKKWWWLAITSPELWISVAVVRMGYATSAFVFAFDLGARRMLVDRTFVSPPRAVEIADDPHVVGAVARFGFGKSSVVLERPERSTLRLRASLEGLDLDVSLDETSAPEAITAIARLGPDLASATEKRMFANVRGAAVVAGRRFALDGAFGGYDYTHGMMPRHTRWNWAFGMGRATDGSPVGFNVVRGFVGEAECAAFDAGGVFPLEEPRFDFDAAKPDQPWRIVGADVDLTFDVGAVHAQYTNLLLVRSRFVQPVGTFRGRLRVGDRDVLVDGLPGVVEDQDVLW
jgi:hypothetical protein